MILSVDGLAVERGGRLLFRDLSFKAAPSDIVAVHGRNGAGKSSLLRVVAGLLEPLAGAVGYGSPSATGGSQDLSPHLHFCGHLDAVKPAMTVIETLAFWGAVFGGPKDGVDKAIADWSLEPLAGLPGQYLSAGQKRRVALARLSVAPRPVWLLDEPSAALDSAAKALLVARGEAHAAGGGTIVAASHEPLWSAAKVLNLDAYAKVAA